MTDTDAQHTNEADVDTVANRAAQVITSMGAEIRALKRERNRYRNAWHNARARAADARGDVEYVEQQAAVPPADRAAPTDWIDGHPQLEAIAAAVWEQCGRSDSGMCVEDDPRNIAVAALGAVLAVLPEPADRAAGWLDAAAECNKAGGAYAERGADQAAGAAFALMETFLRKAGEAEYAATPCIGPVPCEDGGEPCDVHERLMGHTEGDHELCALDCGEPWMRRMADEAQPGTEAHDDYEQTTGHLITCLAVAGGGSDPDCPACSPASEAQQDGARS